MNFGIIADSSCDLSEELQEKVKADIIPLTLNLGSKHITDDASLDVDKFLEEMKACKDKIGSGAPAPGLYAEAMKKVDGTSFVVTLSSRLSGSYNSAAVAQKEVEKDGVDSYVVDSKSASAGEVLVALKLREFIDKGLSKADIISSIEKFIKGMQTFFVLDNIDNLLKNGRLGKISGKLISALNIKLVMGSDGDGNIVLYNKARGVKQIVLKLAETIDKVCPDTDGKDLVIAHCNNLPLAHSFESIARVRYNFRNIFLVKTKGLSSLYANDKGIVIAY